MDAASAASSRQAASSLSVFLYDEVSLFKLAAITVVILISAVGAFLPLRLVSLSEKYRFLVTEVSKYFTAGVFLGVGLLHMLPESADGFERLGWGKFSDGRTFPVAYVMCALGFVIVWFAERHVASSLSTGNSHEKLVAVAAGAESFGGGSICFVQVLPTTSYGPIHCGVHGGEGGGGGGENGSREPSAASTDVRPGGLLEEAGRAAATGEGKGDGGCKSRENFKVSQCVGSAGRVESLPPCQLSNLHHSQQFCHGHREQCASNSDATSTPSTPPIAAAALPPPPPPAAASPPPGSHTIGVTQSGPPCPSSSCTSSSLHSHTHIAHHSHLLLPPNSTSSSSLLLALVFSLHSFMVGAALGTESSIPGAASLLLAIAAHKGTEAFAVGIQFVRENVPLRKTLTTLSLYCLMTPLGIVLGMTALAVQGGAGGGGGSAVADVMQALGAGTVLYIVMTQLCEPQDLPNPLELQDREASSTVVSTVGSTNSSLSSPLLGDRPNLPLTSSDVPTYVQLLLILLGLGLMASVAAIL